MLLVSYSPPAEAGGAGARWRSFGKHLGALGWRVEVVSAPRGSGADPGSRTGGAARARAAARSRLMAVLRPLSRPLWRLLGTEPPPLSFLWVPRGAFAVWRRLGSDPIDLVVATGPQMAALLAARVGSSFRGKPLVVEFRDLWAANPAYDAGGGLLGCLEGWLLRGATLVVTTTDAAAESIRARHPEAAARVRVVGNGFEPELLGRRAVSSRADRAIRLVHSGSLVRGRPLAPLLSVLAEDPYRDRFELLLHGHISYESRRELAAAGAGLAIRTRDPCRWEEAIERIAAADVGLVVQGRAVGDESAVAAKAFEYLALRRPVLCISSGGATERLLIDLGADRYCARLERPATIRLALDRLLADAGGPPPGLPAGLCEYRRDRLAVHMDQLLAGALAPGWHDDR